MEDKIQAEIEQKKKIDEHSKKQIHKKIFADYLVRNNDAYIYFIHYYAEAFL